jgi:threonine aldolase
VANASPAALSRPFDLVSIALSKGLGAPVGSVLAGGREEIAKATRFRRMFGGALRQSGILAAAGLYGLEHNIARLGEDHVNARIIADRLAGLPGIGLDPATVRTNIIVFRLTKSDASALDIVARCREKGVLLLAFSPTMLRAVTHLDVDASACRRAADVVASAVTAKAA